MSGCLVSRYSIARLWSEWEALETWVATLAVSYVSLAARVCNACSLLSIHQQSKLWLVNHFSGWHIPWRSLATRGRGVFHKTAHCKLSLRAPPIASVNSRTLCALVWWKHSETQILLLCLPPGLHKFVPFNRNIDLTHLWMLGKKWILEIKEDFSSGFLRQSESVLQAVEPVDFPATQYAKITCINLHYCESHNSLFTILGIQLGNSALFVVLLSFRWLI